MLVTVPNLPPIDTLSEHYANVRHILKDEPAYYAGIDTSSLCIRPMNMVQVMIACNWDKKMVDWFRWVNRNVCLNLGHDDYTTTSVKLRIATGMLNKIESLTDTEKIQIHSNLVDNVHSEEFTMNAEGLPF